MTNNEVYTIFKALTSIKSEELTSFEGYWLARNVRLTKHLEEKIESKKKEVTGDEWFRVYSEKMTEAMDDEEKKKEIEKQYSAELNAANKEIESFVSELMKEEVEVSFYQLPEDKIEKLPAEYMHLFLHYGLLEG